MNYKACTKDFQVLLRITKLAQSTSVLLCIYYKPPQDTSQFYFALQSLHTPLPSLPSTTLYYNARKRYFPVRPVLLCTTKLAQGTTLYYKFCTSTSLYGKACTKYFPALLCTTKLAHTHTPLPSNTLYYKARKRYFPVALCTTKLARSTPQYYFVLQDKACTNPTFTQRSLFTQSRFYTEKPLKTDAFTHRSFYTKQAFTHKSFYAGNLSHTEKLLHIESFTQRSFYTLKALHKTGAYTQKAFTYRELITQRSFYTQRSFFT